MIITLSPVFGKLRQEDCLGPVSDIQEVSGWASWYKTVSSEIIVQCRQEDWTQEAAPTSLCTHILCNHSNSEKLGYRFESGEAVGGSGGRKRRGKCGDSILTQNMYKTSWAKKNVVFWNLTSWSLMEWFNNVNLKKTKTKTKWNKLRRELTSL